MHCAAFSTAGVIELNWFGLGLKVHEPEPFHENIFFKCCSGQKPHSFVGHRILDCKPKNFSFRASSC